MNNPIKINILLSSDKEPLISECVNSNVPLSIVRSHPDESLVHNVGNQDPQD
jgi:hypothetical protein